MGARLCLEVSYRLLDAVVDFEGFRNQPPQTEAVLSRRIFVFKQFAREISTKQSGQPSGMFPRAHLFWTPHICT